MSEKTKKLWFIVALLAVDLVLFALISARPSAEARAVGLGGGERIFALQRKLKKAGFYNGEINGESDIATRRAVRAFRAANGLEAKGEADCKTLALLGLDSRRDCFSARAELLARYVDAYGGTRYYDMLRIGTEALENSGGSTLCRYMLAKNPGFQRRIFRNGPSQRAYAAALQAIRTSNSF